MNIRRATSYGPLAGAILAAAVLQAVLIARSGTVSADSIQFIDIARDLAERPVDTFRQQDQHPGFAAALLATTRVVQWFGYRAEPESWMLGGRIITFSCGLLSVLMVWLLARDLFDTRVANLAAFVFVALPVPRSNAADSQSDTTHLFFYLLAAWLACTALSGKRPARLACAGLASGVAYWIRPEGLEIAAVGLACLVGCAISARWNWRQLGVSAVALTGTGLLIALPYCVLAGKLTSKQLTFAKQVPTPTYIDQVAEIEAITTSIKSPTSGDAGVAAMPAATNVSAPDGSAPAAVRGRYTVSLVLRLIVKSISAYINSFAQAFKFIFIPMLILGVVELARRRRPSQPDVPWPPLVFIAMLAVVHSSILLSVYIISGYIAHRHMLPLVGLAMPLVALGVIHVGEAIARRTGWRPTHVVAATLGLCVALVLPWTLRPFNREFIPVIAATHWVQDHADSGAGVVSNSPYVGFYGGFPTALLGRDAWTLDEALAKAPGARYDYVILHVGAFEYRSEWVTQLEQRYRQIKELPDPYCLPSHPRKVLIFEAKDLQARRSQNVSDAKNSDPTGHTF